VNPCGDIDDIIKKNAELNAKDMESRSALIKEAVDTSQIRIIPTYYNLESGEVEYLTD